MKMNQKSKIILWAVNLLACAHPGVLYSLAGQESFLPLFVYRIVMPLVWGLLCAAFVRTSKRSSWNKESKKQAKTMMLSMLVLNVFSISAALIRWGSLAEYSLILTGIYLGKIVEQKIS